MVQAYRIKTVAILGCTAVGKSETALRLAREHNGVLIGADSMQIYRGFDIGTGKLSAEECGGIEHKLVDIVDGDAEFSVGAYVELAKQAIDDCYDRRKLPIIVGGTGLYVYSLLSGCDFGGTPKDDGVRGEIKLSAIFLGPIVIHAFLATVDANSSKQIPINDVKRTVRALEIFAVTGVPKSAVVSHTASPYDALTIVLTLPRELLYERINARVRKMFEVGLIEETRTLSKYRDCGSMQALGYKQILENPDMSEQELIELVSRKTRNYAKRQMTYFRNMKTEKIFIDARDADAVDSAVSAFLRE